MVIMIREFKFAASDWQNVNGTDKRAFVDPISNKKKEINELLNNVDENGQLSSDDISKLENLKRIRTTYLNKSSI